MSDSQTTSRKWTKILLIALGVFTVTDLVASHFHRHSFQYTKFFYRIVNGTTFDAGGKAVPIPEQCYLIEHRSDTASRSSTTFGCEWKSHPFVDVTIYRYSSSELAAYRASKHPKLVDHQRYFTIQVEREGKKDIVVYFLPDFQIGISSAYMDGAASTLFIDQLLLNSDVPKR